MRELAKRVDVPAGTLGDYLSGRHVPSTAQRPTIRAVLTECGVADGDVERWLEALARARAASARRGARTPTPYHGLASFEPEDSALFFGRDDQTAEIIERLRTLRADPGPSHGILAVVGPSGSGKSSLLRAGVVAAIRDGALNEAGANGTGRWTSTVMTPGSDPLASLAHATQQAGDGPGVVVIDQFEEVFTSLADSGVRETFLRRIRTHAPDLLVVIGMRADFYAEAAREPVVLNALRHAQVVVTPMSVDAVRAAIVGPAERVGLTLEEGLVDFVLADLAPHDAAGAAHDAGALPLLSHALLSTWERSSGRRLTLADYRATGGIDAAVQRTAEDVYTALNTGQQEVARTLFLRLVNLDGDVAVTRRRIGHDELWPAGEASGEALMVRDVVERFVARRLLTATETSVEISHEALLSAWPRLLAWIDADRAGLQLHRHITVAANLWTEGDRDPALLFTGGRLEGAADWAQVGDHRRLMNEVEREFVVRGVQRRDAEARADRRRARRLTRLLAAVAVLAIVAAGLAVWARKEQRSADRQRTDVAAARDDALSRQVAGQSRELLDADPALAEQLALVADRIAPTSAARGALIDESARPIITRVLGPLGPTALAVSARGDLIAVGHADNGSVHLYAGNPLGRPRALGVLPGDRERHQVFAIAFSPDGSTVATGGQGGHVSLWDLSAPTRPRALGVLNPSFTGAVQSLAFSPDGHTLAAGSVGRSAVLTWDVANVHAVRPLPPPRGLPSTLTVQTVAFSADGARLAAGGNDGAVRLWPAARASTTDPVVITGAGQGSTVNALAFATRRRLLFAGRQSGVTDVYSLAGPTPRLIHTLGAPDNSQVNVVAVSPDETLVATGSSDNTLRRYSVSSWAPGPSTPNPGPVTGAAFSADGGTLLSTAADGTLRIVSATDEQIAVDGAVFAVGYSANGARLLVASNGDGSGVRLWNPRDADRPVPLSPLLTMPRVDGKSAGSIDGTGAITADGDLVAAGSDDGHVELWDTTDPSHPRAVGAPFAAASALVESVAFSPRGRLLAVGADDHTVRLWDVHDPADPTLLATLRTGDFVLGVAFNADGRLLAAASADNHAYLWRTTDPRHPVLLARLGGFKTYVYGVGFDPRSPVLAATSSDHTTHLFDIRNPSRPTPRGSPLIGPTDYVYAAAFDPTGATLAVASSDHTVRLYDVRSGSPIPTQTLHDVNGAVFAVAWSPDGKTLVAAGRHSSALWTVDADAYAAQLCPRAGDPVTRTEWSLYVPGAPYDPPCVSR